MMLVDVDLADHLVHVDLLNDAFQIDPVDDGVDVDGVEDQRDHTLGHRLGQLLHTGADRARASPGSTPLCHPGDPFTPAGADGRPSG